jgi:DNA adenine methylase
LDNLFQVADRIRRVQIESKPALEVIDRHDDSNALFYCDPPYPHEVRGDTNSYGFEMEADEHRELAECLDQCEGSVAVSSYRSDLYDDLFLDQGKGWTCIEADEKTMHTTKDKRQEVLYVNYEPVIRDIGPIGPERKPLPVVDSG